MTQWITKCYQEREQDKRLGRNIVAATDWNTCVSKRLRAQRTSNVQFAAVNPMLGVPALHFRLRQLRRCMKRSGCRGTAAAPRQATVSRDLLHGRGRPSRPR